MGPAGATGYAGRQGDQGASVAGPTGPLGPQGPTGQQGYSGDTGAQGATLVGPTGRTGDTGYAGLQGQSGYAGDTGVVTAGNAGAPGPAGYQGAQGASGSMGAQGPVGIVANWTHYREFSFDRGNANLTDSDEQKASQIAAYLSQNPSLGVGIDGYMNSDRFDRHDRDLSNQRADAVREALMQAGVPAEKIQIGAFADPDRRHEDQVEVLIKTRI
jgi:outer membrane protein OmpA-like peptidoglycan-associated protein